MPGCRTARRCSSNASSPRTARAACSSKTSRPRSGRWRGSEREIVDPEAPLELLDAFSRAQIERLGTAEAARAWSEARAALAALEASRRDRGTRLETIEFQIREIAEAAPDPKEEEELLRERE